MRWRATAAADALLDYDPAEAWQQPTDEESTDSLFVKEFGQFDEARGASLSEIAAMLDSALASFTDASECDLMRRVKARLPAYIEEVVARGLLERAPSTDGAQPRGKPIG